MTIRPLQAPVRPKRWAFFLSVLTCCCLVACESVAVVQAPKPPLAQSDSATTNPAPTVPPALATTPGGALTIDRAAEALSQVVEKAVIPFAENWKKIATLDRYEAFCGGNTLDLTTSIQTITTALSAQSLRYNSEPLSDCSGMVHRVLQRMQQHCPNHSFPSPDRVRSTRDLARWYHEQGELILVQDALEMSALIKPGAIMFYGYRGKTYQDFKAEDLFQQGSGIEHIGVVASVEKDESGVVTNYSLFHGRRPGTVAGITNYHRREPSRATYPPLGNGKQQWVAVARLVNPSMRSAE